MKHVRSDYNRIQDPAGIIPENEPVFLLRGQDPLAPKTIKFWAKQLKKAGGDKNLVKQVKNWAKKMKEYQKGIISHLPDTPRGYLLPDDEVETEINPT